MLHDIEYLLASAQLPTQIISIEEILKGGNNRTYRIETHDGIYALKQYFKKENDLRDRLSTEFSFLQFAHQKIPDWVPKPFFCDTEKNIGLYEFIEGKSFAAGDVGECEIKKAIAFFCHLNQYRSDAIHLPPAAEACFRIQDHLDVVSQRISALQEIKIHDPFDQSAKSLIDILHLYWEKLLNRLKKNSRLHFEEALSQTNRCISPSDFGFHNALKLSDGSMRFLDFEYAGWDDPAKMTGDFFSQVAVPVPSHFFDTFVRAVMAPFPEENDLIERAYFLRSVHQVKWCAIALNIFIPVNLARRRFANPGISVQDLKKAQIEKTEKLIQLLENSISDTY